MSKSLASLCLLRIIYPLCFTACVSCRQDLITAVFLLFLLYVPFVPIPTQNTMNGHTGFFMKLSFATSVIMVLLQIAFQVVLLSLNRYGSLINKKCDGMEKLFRHMGFIKYDSLPLLDLCLHVAPEVIALLTSFFVYILCDRLNVKNVDPRVNAEQGFIMAMIQQNEANSNVRRTLVQRKTLLAINVIGKYLSLAMLCFTSILIPSITSGILYTTFLICVTYWACYKDLGRGFAYVCRTICFVTFIYIVTVFCYQTEFAQEFLHPDGKIPRYWGLQAIHLTNCTTDPRLYIVNTNFLWPSYVLPFALILLYNLLMYESKILLFVSEYQKKQPEGMTRQIKSTRLSQKGQKSSLFRNKTNRWRLATRQAVNMSLSVNSKKIESPNEKTPLIKGRESLYRRSATSGVSQDSHGSITLTNIANDKTSETMEEIDEGEESLKVGIMEYLVDAFITVICFFSRASYIGTNIIMMTWSITYHSWLTFFLLLGAIILWMVPNQRRSMLRVSPFLIFYAEFLLITQFIWGMDLHADELPTFGIDPDSMKQIGFLSTNYPWKPLAIKTLFTTMFWNTMRQYMREKQESRSTSTVAHMMAPVHVTVGTATAMGGDPASKGRQVIQKFGERVRKFMTKFWIWVVTITLFAIGIAGSDMTLFRIMYTALALIFIVTFQLSWVLWRKMMYGFWLTVIIISMIILVTIYTFQFDVIKSLWERMGVDEQWQKYIGLEKKNTSELFFFLIIPTFFVIITVIQLKYFHKDFLLISDIKSRGTSTAKPNSRPSIMSDDEYVTQTEEISSRAEGTSLASPSVPEYFQSPSSSKTLINNENMELYPSRPSFHVFGHSPNLKTLQKIDTFRMFMKDSVEVIWLFLELHIKKFIMILIILVSISEVNVIHFGFAAGASVAMMLNSKLQDIVIRLMSVSAAATLLSEMIFQIKHFDTKEWDHNCTMPSIPVSTNVTQVTLNSAEWLGFYKTNHDRSMLQLLSGYIWIIVAVTFYVVVITRQKYVRHLKGRPLSRSRVLFPRITYKDLDRDVLSCIKYLFNYGFYRFGIEITFISMVILIGCRLDVVALVYAIWLLILIMCSRSVISKVWYVLNLFVAITIPLQYAVVVGLPPTFCFYPFESTNLTIISAMKWLFLPVYDQKPNVSKLFWDFLVLLFITRQTKVFRIEWQFLHDDYPGGSNKSVIREVESPNYLNPVPDFISHKRTYLDIIKHGVMCSLLWISCAVIFLAGTHSVTLFSFGYVISSFLILWQGNDFYLLPIGSIMKYWKRLLTYNVWVMFFKAFFQIPGCIFFDKVVSNACWLAQLLGIVCIDDFAFSGIFPGLGNDDVRNAGGCRLTNEKMGMGMDALCFILLIFQKRLFSSHHFVRIVDDAKAMAVLAARGAELIEELSKKQIQKQLEVEKAVLQKIKNKMDRIKAAQKKIQGHKAKEHHSEERKAPLAQVSSPTISSAISQQGFHTPVEDDFPMATSRPNSYLQPPTPTSAIMTVSLEGYLEPQRISFGSPPMSYRPFSFEESCHTFSLPPYGLARSHRRQSSMGFYPLHWMHSSTTVPRRSMSISSHHTSIRSGDYYMFDEPEPLNLIEDVDERDANEENEEEYQGKTLGKLMESVMKTDMKHALQLQSSDESKSSTSKYKHSENTSKLSITSSDDDQEGGVDDDNDCSTCEFKSTDATTSKDVTDSLDNSSDRVKPRKSTSFVRCKSERRPTEGKDDSTDSDATLVSRDSADARVTKCWEIFIMYLKFAIAFFSSCMVSMIQFLNRKSKDYRYVIQALENEKKILKETKNLRVGMRISPGMKWQPIPASMISQRPRSALKMEEFESQGLVASSQPVFVRLLLAIYHALMSHSELVCYFAVFMLQIRNPTLASLPLILMVFFWGSLSIPRPTKRFWVTIIAYTELVVVIKSLCQSEFIPIQPIPDDKPFYWVRILGIEKETHYGTYDLILLLAVFFHRSTLKSLGLWKSTEDSTNDKQVLNLNYVEPQHTSMVSGSESEAMTEITTVNLIVADTQRSEDLAGQSTDSYQNQQVPPAATTSDSSTGSKDNVYLLWKSINDFFNKLLYSKNQIADDVYAYMFFCDFCNIIVIIFGYSSFGSSRGDGGVTQYIEDNKIPIAFLLMVILQFALIVIDRWLYLSRYIFGKLVFQYLLVIGIHIWMFFLLPAVTERKFNEALPPSLWYLIKCFYLLLSAYQIRSGYPTRILGNFLCKNYNLVNMVLFKIFMLIPFVYELRTLMDWIWTETSMTLADWIKMEDIFAQIFQLKCIRRAESKYPQLRGHKVPAKTKFIYGAGGLITLFTIIWFPLVLFALGDTVGEPNRPTEMAARVQISSYQPIYTSSTSKIYSLTEQQWESFKKVYSSGSAQTFLSDYNPDDVGVVFLPHYSSSIWTIPIPEEADLKKELKTSCTSMKVTMEWTIHRNSENPESPKTVSEQNSVEMNEVMCNETTSALETKDGSNVTIPKLMPKFLKVTTLGKASPVLKLMYQSDDGHSREDNDSFVDVRFQLEKDNISGGVWWNAAENITSNLQFLKELDKIANNNSETTSLIIYTFNDKMFPPGLLSIISGKGIIGLYTTFVIVVGAYVKGYFTNTAGQIMTEDIPYVDRILQLCLDIFLVRERREFDLEEDLFAKLLFLYRSPETMIKWTRPPEDGGSDEY